jgi:hypothetical protein
MTFSEVEQPETYEERKELAEKTCDELHIATTVVIDDMENTVRETYGRLPNSAYIIDRWPDILRGLVEDQS